MKTALLSLAILTGGTLAAPFPDQDDDIFAGPPSDTKPTNTAEAAPLRLAAAFKACPWLSSFAQKNKDDDLPPPHEARAAPEPTLTIQPNKPIDPHNPINAAEAQVTPPGRHKTKKPQKTKLKTDTKTKTTKTKTKSKTKTEKKKHATTSAGRFPGPIRPTHKPSTSWSPIAPPPAELAHLGERVDDILSVESRDLPVVTKSLTTIVTVSVAASTTGVSRVDEPTITSVDGAASAV